MAVVPITAAKGPTAEPQNDTDMAIAAALLHREGHFDQGRFDDLGNLKIKQSERPLYPKGDPYKGDYYEGPMKLTPGTAIDPKAIGFEGSSK